MEEPGWDLKEPCGLSGHWTMTWRIGLQDEKEKNPGGQKQQLPPDRSSCKWANG